MTAYLYFVDMFFIAVILGYLNHKYIKMQTTIAIMSASLVFSSIIIIFGNISFFQEIKLLFTNFSNKLDFHVILMKGMLPYLLFAGSINIDLGELKAQKYTVGILSIFSTILSTLFIAISIYYVLYLFDQVIPFGYCLLFGSLISPTDPIAVLGVLKDFDTSGDLTIKLAGESLFNDGVGIVLFTTFYTLVFGGGDLNLFSSIHLFVLKSLGGIAWGIILGLIMHQLIKSIDDQKLEVLITIAFVSIGYSLAEHQAISGPLAMVVSGIFIGNKTDIFSNNEKSQSYLLAFWEVIDEILNALLFLLMGLEILVIDYNISILLMFLTILIVLAIRYITVALPMLALNRFVFPDNNEIPIIVWGGLRGGLAIALVLALPPTYFRDVILSLTYSVVVFSIIIQGSTVKYLIKK
jgi:CPA1 family monovalent cation:H+ antiporter